MTACRATIAVLRYGLPASSAHREAAVAMVRGDGEDRERAELGRAASSAHREIAVAMVRAGGDDRGGAEP